MAKQAGYIKLEGTMGDLSVVLLLRRFVSMPDDFPSNHLLHSSASAHNHSKYYCAEFETSYPFYLGSVGELVEP